MWWWPIPARKHCDSCGPAPGPGANRPLAPALWGERQRWGGDSVHLDQGGGGPLLPLGAPDMHHVLMGVCACAGGRVGRCFWVPVHRGHVNGCLQSCSKRAPGAPCKQGWSGCVHAHGCAGVCVHTRVQLPLGRAPGLHSAPGAAASRCLSPAAGVQVLGVGAALGYHVWVTGLGDVSVCRPRVPPGAGAAAPRALGAVRAVRAAAARLCLPGLRPGAGATQPRRPRIRPHKAAVQPGAREPPAPVFSASQL